VHDENDDDDCYTTQTQQSELRKDSALIINDELNPIDVPLPPDSIDEDDGDSGGLPPATRVLSHSHRSIMLKSRKKNNKASS